MTISRETLKIISRNNSYLILLKVALLFLKEQLNKIENPKKDNRQKVVNIVLEY
ncbi:MAG: hypothetical protein ACJAQX_001390 [Polaribacter sp.]|jgi:hypothetical protein